MKINTFLLKVITMAVVLLAVFFTLKSEPVLAQNSSLREDAFDQLYSAAGSDGADLGQYRDPRETVARIIRVALGVLGTIFLVLTVYAGFLWLTASGEEENISKAKKLLTASIIGLAIILAAYSLSNFIFDRLVKSTTGRTSNPLQEDFCLKNPNDDACWDL